MKMVFLSLLLITSTVLASGPAIKGEYPKGPDASMTPGSLCDRPDEYRYAEKIPYCNRDVDSSLKADIFQDYRNIGWQLPANQRSSYKIDHLIPLCMGGSNQENNLWPQHVSVYQQTDLLEQVGCDKMKAGKLKQAEAIKMLLAAKRDLTLVKKTLDYFQSL